MIFPTVNDLNKDTYNRYEVALAVAKCARMITNEYVRQRAEAESTMTGNKETDRPLNTMIDKEVRDEKAVTIAVRRIVEGKYVITHKPVEEQEREERAVLEGIGAKEQPFTVRDEDEIVDTRTETVDAEDTLLDDEAVTGDDVAADSDAGDSAADSDMATDGDLAAEDAIFADEGSDETAE